MQKNETKMIQKQILLKSNLEEHQRSSSEAEFKEFEPRLKFEMQLKYGWFHLNCNLFFKI